MTLDEFVQQCINGLSLGSTYALLALAFFIQTVLQISVSAEPEPIAHTGWSDRGYSVGPYTVGLIQIITTAVTFAVLVALVVFLRRTLLGVSIRAAAEDFAVVRLMGISAGRGVVAAFALSRPPAGGPGPLLFPPPRPVGPPSRAAPDRPPLLP